MRIVVLLNLIIVLLSSSALTGCASKPRGSYVILGMSYSEAKSIINLKDSSKMLVEEVWRNRTEDKLIIRFVHLDGDKADKVALVYEDVIKIVAPNELGDEIQEVPDGRQNPATADVKWAGYLYDKHPETGQLLIQESRRFMARCYEYDPATHARKSAGLARQYMLYVRREFANKLRLRLPRSNLTFKEPANFTKNGTD